MWIFIVLSLVFANTLQEGRERKSMVRPGIVQKYTISQYTLLQNKNYEVRISYLGTVGASIKIEWDCDLKTLRSLKDTEKLSFSTDSQGKIIGDCYNIRVYATRNTRSVDKKSEDEPVWYLIKLEKYSDNLHVPESVVPAFLILALSILLSIVAYKVFIIMYKKILEKEKSKLRKDH